MLTGLEKDGFNSILLFSIVVEQITLRMLFCLLYTSDAADE